MVWGWMISILVPVKPIMHEMLHEAVDCLRCRGLGISNSAIWLAVLVVLVDCAAVIVVVVVVVVDGGGGLIRCHCFFAMFVAVSFFSVSFMGFSR